MLARAALLLASLTCAGYAQDKDTPAEPNPQKPNPQQKGGTGAGPAKPAKKPAGRPAGKPAKKMPPAADVVVLMVPNTAAPVVDGKLDDAAWKQAADFEVRRNDDVYGRGRVMLAGRTLYISLHTDLSPRELGLRFNFRDRVTKLSTMVLVSPLTPPRPPIALFRRPAGRNVQRRSARHSDVRFDFARKTGFVTELKLPLDLLEIPRNDKTLEFSCEIWDVGGPRDRPLAIYPAGLSTVAGADFARLKPETDWGKKAPLEPELPVQPVIHLMERIEAERADRPIGDIESKPLLFTYMGWKDGRRNDVALKRVQGELEAALEKCPEYSSLHAHLMWVHLARNDFAAALAAQETIAKNNPVIRNSRGHVLIRSELLRNMGRYEQAAGELAAFKDFVRDSASARDELAMLRELIETSRLEKKMQAEDKAKGDLPRVRFETSKGVLVLELFEDDTPNAVANFITLVENGSYNGTRFHWAAGGRRVAGGDPNSRNAEEHDDGYGGPGYKIESQPGRRLHHRYTIGFVDSRAEQRTEGSIFMIHIAAIPARDGRNTVFGRVIEGFDTVRALEYGDHLKRASVLRKRKHDYKVVKRRG